MSDWNFVNRYRVRTGPLGSTPALGFNGYFCIPIHNKQVKVIASDGGGWKHVSVSLHGEPQNTPSYKIMCEVARLFFEDDEWIVQYRPAKTDYVNYHPGCLHWWKPLDTKLPTPPSFMVGPKVNA